MTDTKAAHTPGPWGVEPVYGWVRDKNLNCVAQYRHSNFIQPDEQVANAHLIAAAPDLLEAIEEMLADLPELQYVGARFFSAVDIARAAIAKATDAA